MTEIRQAPGDDAEAPQYIETVPRRGYRFIAAVTRVARPSNRSLYVAFAVHDCSVLAAEVFEGL